jgi:hypothetical protein
MGLIMTHHATKAYGLNGGIAPSFLTSTLDDSKWSPSRPSRFISREINPGTHCIGVCVGPRVSLYVIDKTQISFPYRKSNSGSSFVQPVA